MCMHALQWRHSFKIESKKKENLGRVVHELECLTPEASDIVECCHYKTVLHACELVASDRPFLFPNMYRLCST